MKQNGVLKVVISPGSRHYPLIRSLESDPEFTLYSVVDERSAAFFALGLIQETGAPVAVCCTSGTSAANYSSAVIEAFYQGLPLVVLTADRLPALLNQKEEQMFQQQSRARMRCWMICSASLAPVVTVDSARSEGICSLSTIRVERAV